MALLALPGILATSGCGADADVTRRVASESIPTATYPQAKAAASLLSLGNVNALAGIDDRYRASLRCQLALELLRTGANGTGPAFNAEQSGALAQVGTLYRRRAEAEGRQRGKSAAAIAADRERERAELSDLATAGRVAMGCLRVLT